MNGFIEHRGRVAGVDFLSPEIFELRLERNGVAFTPGDCIQLFGEGGESRPYSLCSGSQDPFLGFLVRRMPGGAVSEWLAARKPGDTVRHGPPFGWFRPGRADGCAVPSVFVATGTGIAPFLSALRSYPAEAPILCLYGVRRLEDAVYRDFLAARCPLQLAISREMAPPHHHGRVTDLLGRVPRGPATHYYLCGLDAMTDEITSRLEAEGVPQERIHREVFFTA